MRVESITNFRDVGGHATRDGFRVRRGVVFRSGHLALATDRDLGVLHDLGVRVVIDFRGPADIASEGPDRLPPGAELVPIPMFERTEGPDIRTLLELDDPALLAEHFGEGRSMELMRMAAVSFVTQDERCEQYARMLRRLAEPDGTPAIIHCSAGKDRTGWAASLLLLALGVDERDVVAHYLETNDHRRAGWEERLLQLEGAGIDPSLIEPFFGVHEDFARASLAVLQDHWGGIEGYLRDGLCVERDLLDHLRSVMLEPDVRPAPPARLANGET